MQRKKRFQGCRIFVTSGREYIVREGSCIIVRERHSGRWRAVLPNRILGAVPREETDPEFVTDPCLGTPRVGERLCIQVGGGRLVTEPILAVEER